MQVTKLTSRSVECIFVWSTFSNQRRTQDFYREGDTMSKEPAFRGSGGMVPQEYFISWSLQRQVQHCESIVLVHNTPVIEKLCILISEVSYPLHHSLLISSNAFYNFFFGGRNNYCGSLGRGLSTLGPTPHLPCNGSQESCMLFSMKRTFVPKHTLENNSCSF